MKIGPIFRQLRHPYSSSAGTIVFGVEDGTVSIFGSISRYSALQVIELRDPMRLQTVKFSDTTVSMHAVTSARPQLLVW
jgi:hypothetical protein